MKALRQAKLLELIGSNTIDTQEELQSLLIDAGFMVTQATVSRDIRELGVIKTADDNGAYRYRAPETKESGISDKFALILKQAALRAEAANNLVVIKTYTGMGSAAGAAVDAMNLSGVVGTLAGDDTLLVIAHDNTSAESICALLHELIG